MDKVLTLSFTLNDIMSFLIYLLVIGLLIYLIKTFYELHKAIKNINDFCTKNSDSVSSIILNIDSILDSSEGVVNKFSGILLSMPDEITGQINGFVNMIPKIKQYLSILNSFFGRKK